MRMKINRRLVALVVGLVACAGCSSDVEIKNESQFPVRRMVIQVGGSDLRVDKLGPGETVAVYYKPKTDSSIAVTFQTDRDSVARSCTADIYVTSPSQDHFLVVVKEDSNCQVLRKL
ncbi:hypothetical protein [Lysobacter capsici]|uniref:hypothetical protein n=1 Tax=Lysobacter capsici TaxID=435897 RepID=UPI00287B6BD1|nr:hypothetical protein [Lysobacter capsici]WND80441.1 hypothetical protein RJ610_24725 [Lysobacter capsici]WND85638.1 hypothetical protein RJ609_24745 [Lysobacter capsici]